MHIIVASLATLLGASQLCTSLFLPETQHPFILSDNPFHHNPFDHIKKALKKADIIDDIVDSFTPKCFVTPTYFKDTGGSKKEYPVYLGDHLNPKKTKKKPSMKVLCPGMNQTSGMTIVLTDPDAPSRKNPKWGEMCHWIAGVKSVRPEEFEVEDTDIIEYKAPAPPEKTGHHRYVFILLEGVNTNLTAPNDRKHWGHEKAGHGVRDWSKQEGLNVIGGNFFYARHHKGWEKATPSSSFLEKTTKL